MRQVFLNILDNAAKHGGAGKRIETEMTFENDEVVVGCKFVNTKNDYQVSKYIAERQRAALRFPSHANIPLDFYE